MNARGDLSFIIAIYIVMRTDEAQVAVKYNHSGVDLYDYSVDNIRRKM